jgi:hypothetical protein
VRGNREAGGDADHQVLVDVELHADVGLEGEAGRAPVGRHAQSTDGDGGGAADVVDAERNAGVDRSEAERNDEARADQATLAVELRVDRVVLEGAIVAVYRYEAELRFGRDAEPRQHVEDRAGADGQLVGRVGEILVVVVGHRHRDAVGDVEHEADLHALGGGCGAGAQQENHCGR